MAVRWRSSGTNETGRVFGFEGGIQGQNTTARHEEGCGGAVRNLVQTVFGGEHASMPSFEAPSALVDFADAVRIAFGMDENSPASRGWGRRPRARS